ncbi:MULTISPECIES: hypothetical protein [unclassified Mesorhizobium]|nr:MULTISPECIES: hypothetical protein [unclassified Mesorhizobium]
MMVRSGKVVRQKHRQAEAGESELGTLFLADAFMILQGAISSGG